VHQLVRDGRNSAAITAPWNGSGLMTSQSDAIGPNKRNSLAVATAGEVGKSTFGGTSVNPSDVLVMYTYGGDADLSGYIDADDYFAIDSNYNDYYHSDNTQNVGLSYTAGDFDYDGDIDGDDFFIIDDNFVAQGPPIAGGAPVAGVGGVSAVPEPAGAALLTLALAPLLRRRRRS
jgi:hypothetical protein